MRAFLALVDKEWRGARPLVLAFAALVPIALYAGEAIFMHWRRPEVSGAVIFGVVVLFAAVICSDLVATERESGQSGSFALLPVGGGSTWLAKVVFAMSSILMMAAWTALSALLVHGQFGTTRHLGLLIDRVEDDAFASSMLTVAATGSALLFSTILRRGLPATILALAVSALTVVAVGSVQWVSYGIVRIDTAHAFMAAAIAGGMLALGSLIAHVRRVVHTGSAVRRAAVALGAPVALVVLTGGAVAGVAHTRTSLAPGHPEAGIHAMRASADGRHLALTVSRRGQHQRRVWVLDTRNGESLELDGRNRVVDNPGFTRGGALRVVDLEFLVVPWRLDRRGEPRVDSRVVAYREIDPVTGRTLRVLDADEAERVTPRGVASISAARGPAREPPHAYRVEYAELGIDCTIESYCYPRWSRPRGSLLFQPEEYLLVRRDLISGEDLLRVPVRGPAGTSQVTERALLVRESLPDGRQVSRILDSTTGELLYGPFGALEPGAPRFSGMRPVSAAGDWLFLHDRDAETTALLNIGTGAIASWTDLGGTWPPSGATVIPGLGTAFADGPRIIVLDDEGNIVRTYLDGE